MPKAKWPILIIIALLLLGVAYYLYSSYLNPQKNGRNIITASGTIEATEILVGSKVPGRVKEVLVKEGQKANPGDLLATLDDREFQAQLNQAKATLALAEANFQDALSDYNRNKKLVDEEVISKAQFEKITTKLEAARASSQQAASSVELARTLLENTKITAPSAGTVLQRLLEPGEIVAAGGPVVSLVDLSDIWVRIYIPESQLGKINLGDEAKISVDSFPGKDFPGKITNISDEAEFTPKNIQTKEERVKLVFAVKVTAQNSEGALKPGMAADVTINLKNDSGNSSPKPQ